MGITARSYPNPLRLNDIHLVKFTERPNGNAHHVGSNAYHKERSLGIDIHVKIIQALIGLHILLLTSATRVTQPNYPVKKIFQKKLDYLIA
jgi:hypothetical protein